MQQIRRRSYINLLRSIHVLSYKSRRVSICLGTRRVKYCEALRSVLTYFPVLACLWIAFVGFISTPSKPVHCIVWAKQLFALMFGKAEESMLYEDPVTGRSSFMGQVHNKQLARDSSYTSLSQGSPQHERVEAALFAKSPLFEHYVFASSIVG